MSDFLKLLALDAEDLAIVSSHVQDAVLKLGDIKWLATEKRLVLAMNRFVWEAAIVGGPRTRTFERRRAALHFDRVTSVKARGLAARNSEAVVSLLAIRFEETDPPAGTIELIFAGGGTMRLTVEVLEAQLADLGAAWATGHAPEHDI